MAVKLPYNEVAEKTILGATLLYESAQPIVMSSLTEEHFFVPVHRIIFQALTTLYANHRAIDVAAVLEELLNTGKLEQVGGVLYVSSLCDEILIVENIEYHVKVLQDKELLRRILTTMEDKLINWSESKISDVGEYLADVERDILAITKDRRADGFEKVDTILERVKERAIKEVRNASNLSGIPTGFIDLDRCTGGMHPSTLIILAARPGMGKSALALNIAVNSIEKNNNKGSVAFFSLEMDKEDLIMRILSSQCRLEKNELKYSLADERKSQRIQLVINKLSNMNLFFDASPTIKLSDLQVKARQLKRIHSDLHLIVIDHIGLVAPNKATKNESRQETVAEISRTLKSLARELKVPILCLSQLSRSIEKRPDKHPMLSDLRESGSIEQDADIVLFIHRDDYYMSENEKEKNNIENPVAEIIIAKHRNGEVGKVNTLFVKEHSTFNNLASNSHAEQGSRD